MEFSQPKGIYQQIADQMRDRILAGERHEGERSPSARERAVGVGVKPNTVTNSDQARRDRERSERLVSVLVDGLARWATLIAPAREWAVQDHARDEGCRVDVFSGADDVPAKDRKIARSAAWVAEGHVVVEHRGRIVSREALRAGVAHEVQEAAVLAQRALEEAACQRATE
jgi:DNA-binding transcriptional MocR family regulator